MRYPEGFDRKKRLKQGNIKIPQETWFLGTLEMYTTVIHEFWYMMPHSNKKEIASGTVDQ
jgi:hypothetical protein